MSAVAPKSRWTRLIRGALRHPIRFAATTIWSVRTVAIVQRDVRAGRIQTSRLPIAPRAPEDAELVVNAVARAAASKCLTRSIVRQEWFSAQGKHYDLVIGVTNQEGAFSAHAWIDIDPPSSFSGFDEILRRAPGEELIPPVEEACFTE